MHGHKISTRISICCIVLTLYEMQQYKTCIATRYRSVVCLSVTVAHPAKAVGLNEMSFGMWSLVTMC